MLALSTLLAAAVSLQTSVPVADQTAIKAAYGPFIKGYETKNWKVVANCLTEDFRHTNPAMVSVDKSKALKAWAEQMAPLTGMKLSARYEKFWRNPGTTSVFLTYSVKAKFKDSAGEHTLVVKGLDEHAWRWVKAKWVLCSIREHNSTTMIDGQVVDVQPPKKK